MIGELEMADESVKKKGYLSKLPVKGLVKVKNNAVKYFTLIKHHFPAVAEVEQKMVHPLCHLPQWCGENGIL